MNERPFDEQEASPPPDPPEDGAEDEERLAPDGQDTEHPAARSLSLAAERDRVVEDVLRDQAAKEQARKSSTRRPGTTPGRVAALMVLALLSIYLWTWSPSWLAPAGPPELALGTEQAGLRVAMYIQAQRIEDFRDTRGRLPDVLREAGEPLPGMLYDRIDARTYRLRGAGDRVRLLYVSSDSLQIFAGDSPTIVGLTP